MDLLSRLRPRYDGAIVATFGGIFDRVRDRNHVLSIDATDRLEGKRCLVTGANRGLGLAVASELARRGAHVILACRSGTSHAVEIVRRGASRRATVEALHLDLSDLASVDKAALSLDGRPLDILILNAGIVPREARRTRDGYDESFQVNFLANVLFVRRLLALGLLSVTAPDEKPRIVVVSSESHRSSPPIVWEGFGEFRRWGMREAVEQYGYGKLLLQTFAEELSRRLEGRIAVHSLCPGAVRSDIGREAPRWAKPALDLTMRAFFKAPEEAALPVVYLAAARAIEGETGVYLHVKRRRDVRKEARDPDLGRKIWDEAERLLESSGHPLKDTVEGDSVG